MDEWTKWAQHNHSGGLVLADIPEGTTLARTAEKMLVYVIKAAPKRTARQTIKKIVRKGREKNKNGERNTE